MKIHQNFVKILEEKGLIRIGELSELSGRIGIDAEQWLSHILPDDTNSEMMGAISMSLRPVIQSEVNRLISLGLTPLFVFSGIPVFDKPNTGQNKLWSENEIEKRSYIKMFPKKYMEFPYITNEIFSSLGCESFKSPYLVSPQLAYFLKSGLVSCLLGLSDLLFYSVPVIIIEIMQTRYKYIISEEVFDSLQLTPLELKQAFVLNGYLGSLSIDIPLYNLVDTLKFVRAETLISQAVLLEKIVNALNCSVVLSHDPPGVTYEGTSNVYGQKLTKDLYYALSTANLSHYVFQLISQSKFFEKTPTADSNHCRRILTSLKEIKSSTLAVLSSFLPKEYMRGPFKIQTWYSEIEDEVGVRPLSFINWKIDSQALKKALSSQKKNFADIQFCFKWHMEDFETTKELISSAPVDTGNDLDVIYTKILFNFFEAIGYIYPDGVPTLFETSFLKIDPEWQYSAFYMQEIIKYGMLNGRTLNQTQCSQLSEDEFKKYITILTDDDSRHAIVLISRVFSLVQPTLNEENWTGEIDYDLAQFHSLVYLIFRNYQSLFEAIVLKEFFTCPVLNKGILEICKRSPLLPLPNPALGIAVKRLLILDDVEKVAEEMPHMADLFLDLQRGWMFWKNFVKIMGVFKQFNAVPEMSFINEISAASKRLKNVLMRARIQIGN